MKKFLAHRVRKVVDFSVAFIISTIVIDKYITNRLYKNLHYTSSEGIFFAEKNSLSLVRVIVSQG